MAQKTDEDTQTSLEKIKKRLSSPSTNCIMEGSLLKRSETLRKWNQRWFMLDPTTGKMEYRVHQGDSSPRGFIFFDPESTITLSPINFHGTKKYDGCCFYVGNPQKKEYYLCAETPGVARAWVSTLRAASLVLKAHKEAVDSLSGNGHAKLGTVAAVVAAANATARESIKEMQQSMKGAMKPNQRNPSQEVEVSGEDVSIVMKETLRVKDEELNQVARDLRARDFMIKEMAYRLSETAEAAEAAATAARSMEKERRLVQADLDDLKKEFDNRLYHTACEVKAGEERVAMALKARELALREAQRWQVELGKGREQIVMMEGAVARAEDNARRAIADAEEKVKAAKASEFVALIVKEQAMNEVKQWQAQADYYQAQAARYLGILQQKEAVTVSTLEHLGEVHQTDKMDESVIRIPDIQVAAPSEKTLPDMGLKLNEGTYDTISPDTEVPTPKVDLVSGPLPIQLTEAVAPTPTAEGPSEPDKHSNYITAVDFEQLQVDTYHYERPPVDPELQSKSPPKEVSPIANTVANIYMSIPSPTSPLSNLDQSINAQQNQE